jgi:hypothetical protein
MAHPTSFLKLGASIRTNTLSARRLIMTNREAYIAPIPEAERKDMVLAYHAQLNAADDEVRLRAAKAWSTWE